MYRTIKQSHALIKRADPDTAITEYRIRELVNSKSVHCMRVGKKVLIDCRSLQDFLGMILIAA